jgi:hypothetical protein
MAIINKPSEEGESKANPTAINHAAIIGGALDESTSDSGGERPENPCPEIGSDFREKLHSFCPILARDYGEEAAVIVQGLGYKVAKSKKTHNGCKWHYDTLEALAKRWPYLSDSGIHGILQRETKNGLIVKGRFNKWSLDRTTWYSLREDLVDRALDYKGKLWFDVPVAVRCHSIIAGTLYQNLRYQLLLLLADDPTFEGKPYRKINKAALARILPWSLSTIKREYAELVKKGCVTANPQSPTEYTICNEADLVVPLAMRKSKPATSRAAKSGLSAGKSSSSVDMVIGSTAVMTGSFTEIIGSSTEKIVSSTEDNTHYKPLEKAINKHHSQYAPREVCGACVDAADAALAAIRCDTDTSSTVPVEEDTDTASNHQASLLAPRQNPRTLDELRGLIATFSTKVSDEDKAAIRGWAKSMAVIFVSEEISLETLRVVVAAKSASEVLGAVASSLFRTVEEHGINSGWSQDTRDLCYVRELDIVTGAYLLCTGREEVLNRQFEERWGAIVEVYKVIQLPGDLDGAPAQDKADSLISEIRRCNLNGWPTYDEGNVSFTVDPAESTRKAAVDFFEAYPEVTTSKAWEVLCDCVEVKKIVGVPAGHDPLWHVRDGVTPRKFFKYYYTIRAELDASYKGAP